MICQQAGLGAFGDQKMSKSAKAKVVKHLARESYHIREQKIHSIRGAMAVQLSGAEKVTTSKGRHFQVHLTSAKCILVSGSL